MVGRKKVPISDIAHIFLFMECTSIASGAKHIIFRLMMLCGEEGKSNSKGREFDSRDKLVSIVEITTYQIETLVFHRTSSIGE